MAKNKAQAKDNKKHNKNNPVMKKENGSTRISSTKDPKDGENNSNKKINYVLHPRLLKKKIIEQKQDVQRQKVKSYQTKKHKRNAIFMRKTERGQPKLNARMKVLYDQIAKSCERT